MSPWQRGCADVRLGKPAKWPCFSIGTVGERLYMAGYNYATKEAKQ